MVEKNLNIFKNGDSGDFQDFLLVPSGSTESSWATDYDTALKHGSFGPVINLPVLS